MGVDQVQEEGVRPALSLQALPAPLPGQQQLLRQVSHPVGRRPADGQQGNACLHVTILNTSLSVSYNPLQRHQDHRW